MLKSLATAGVIAVFGMNAQAASVTPDVLFGTEFSNQGFTVATLDELELGLRVRLQHGPNGANDDIGDGIKQDLFDAYTVTGTGSTAPVGEAFWAFDMAINTDKDQGSIFLSAYSYSVEIDVDPGNTYDMVTFDPLATPAFFGDNTSVNGAVSEQLGDPDIYNVAQQSFNYGYFDDAPLLNGMYSITLTAWNRSGAVLSTSIDIIVENTPVPTVVVGPGGPLSPVPLPAGFPMLLTGLGAFFVMRRLKAA